MNAIDLKGRIAIVTGAARGIGFAVAQKHAALRARTVALWDIDAAALDEAVAALKHSGVVYVATVDVTDEASIAAAVDALIRDAGKIDILVNNAGITGGNAPLWELAPDVWRRVIEVNLIGPYLVCRAIVPHMIAAGYGRIVNIASIAGKDGNPNASHYSASKAGLIGLTKSLGKELATTGVLVNCITPAAAKTEMFGADEAGAYRLHAVENPDEPLRRGRRDRGHGRRGLPRRSARSRPARCSIFPAAGRCIERRQLGLDPAGDGTLHADPFRAVSSAEEHFLDMEGVRGSIPLPPTSLRSRSE